jgi:adenosylhomocysteine nucleosidase
MKKILALFFLLLVFADAMYAKTRKIGLLVAVEQKSVFEKYGKAVKSETKGGFNVYCYKNKDYTLVVINSGVGEIAAAAATQVLIDFYNVEIVVNFGVAGALSDKMKLAEGCIVEKIVHYDFDLSGIDPVRKGQYPDFENEFMQTDTMLIDRALEICPELQKVTCASADKFIATKEDKEKLRLEFSADICEMESAGIFLTCRRNNVPCVFIKAISDSLTGGGKEFYQEYLKSAAHCLEITDKIIKGL